MHSNFGVSMWEWFWKATYPRADIQARQGKGFRSWHNVTITRYGEKVICWSKGRLNCYPFKSGLLPCLIYLLHGAESWLLGGMTHRNPRTRGCSRSPCFILGRNSSPPSVTFGVKGYVLCYFFYPRHDVDGMKPWSCTFSSGCWVIWSWVWWIWITCI